VISKFEFNVADCDVEDKAALQKYRTIRTRWLDWLEQDESHAILPLIQRMAWNDVAFQFFIHMAENDASSPLRNTLIAEAVIEGHFATQALAIRRLMDTRSDVISLRKLLSDLKNHRHLLTRENYVSYDGLPYDYEQAEQRVWLSRVGKGPFWTARSGPDAYNPSKRAHESFDKLAGVTPECRTRTDQIQPFVFDRLSAWLDSSGAAELVHWTNKLLAHSAGADSRRAVDLSAAAPTLGKIKDVVRSFARVSQAISQLLLFESGFGDLVPVAQFDRYEFLSSTAISDGDREKLDRYWDRLADERTAFLDDVSIALCASAPRQQ